jgi:subtilase family serine protease
MRSTATARLARRGLTLIAVAAAGLGTVGAAGALARPQTATQVATSLPVITGHIVGLSCDAAFGGALGCDAQAESLPGDSGPEVMKGPTGLTPAQIESAYALTGLNGGGRTVAVVDAYNDPKLASDLKTYRAQFGLPKCTAKNGCLSIVNEKGKASPLPSGDPGWGTEESLDVDAISAACPSCHIRLVEASSTSDQDLGTAVQTAAATPGVVAISNSYGGSESAGQTAYDADYHHPGIAVTVSSGDDGYGVEFPASSPYVTAVGGTTLTSAGNARGWTESAWSGAGSGCSAYEPKPSWQTDSGCARRTVADVSADADPNSGLGIYDTYNNCGTSTYCDTLIEEGIVPGLDGWAQVGGTSLSSPLIASVYALAGNTASANGANLPYAHPSALNDVTSGSNGSCGGSYLCTAGPGYDGPTGLGTPNGIGAF